MSLNITNLLSTLKQFYDTQNNGGEKSHATKDKIDNFLSSKYDFNLSAAMNEVKLTEGKLSDTIYTSDGQIVKVSSEIEQNFSYKEVDGKLIIFGSNLTIDMPPGISNEVEIVGISNKINTQENDDRILLLGYGNTVNAGDGEDEVVSLGGNNLVNQAEVINTDLTSIDVFSDLNIENAAENSAEIKGKFSVTKDVTEIEIGGKIYNVKINGSVKDAPEKVEVSYSLDDKTKVITFTADGVTIEAQDGQDDLIKLVGKDNILYTGDLNDDVEIVGNRNIVHTDEGVDSVVVDGSYNKVYGDAGVDDVNVISGKDNEVHDVESVDYTGKSATILLKKGDTEPKYIKVGDYEYLIQRNPSSKSTDDISVSYSVDASGKFTFTGNDFILEAQNDALNDDIVLKGNNVQIQTGDGDDKIAVFGNNNVIDGGDGTDNLGVSGDNNKYIGIETFGGTVTLSKDNQGQTVQVGNLYYTFSSVKPFSTDADAEDFKINITYEFKDGVFCVNADDIIIRANDGQEDNIKLIGNNSKVYAKDGNDTVYVEGNNNYIDGWSGDDKLTAKGRGNKVYGFLGNDDITIIETPYTDEDLAKEIKYLTENNDKDKPLSENEILQVAKDNLNKYGANYVDGEFDKDTVNTNSYYSKISVDTEVYTSAKQNVLLTPDEAEKEIVVDGKTYTIKNYATADNDNPFVNKRTIWYEVVDKQLIVHGNYISVVAADGQEDNVKIVGDNSYLDMGDGNDTLEVEGSYNLLFGGIGKDYLKVIGDNNRVNGDFVTDITSKLSKEDDDIIEVEGNNNYVAGGTGLDSATIKGKDNILVEDLEEITGSFTKRETLTPDKTETEISVNGNKYKIKINKDGEIEEDVQFTYDYDSETGLISIDGDDIHIIANDGQSDNIALKGANCIIELGDGDDKADIIGVNNKVYGGDGDDEIRAYGTGLEIFGEGGANKYTVLANKTKVIGNANDKLTITGNPSNSYSGISPDNVTTDPDIGVAVISEENKFAEISYIDSEGDRIVFEISPNIVGPAEFADVIFVDYEIKTLDNGEKQLVINGSCIKATLQSDSRKGVNVKIVGQDNRLETFSGDDTIEVVGTKNEVYSGQGQNTLKVEGNYNSIAGGIGVDTFDINGNENTIIGNGEKDNVTLAGVKNKFLASFDSSKKGGSLVLTKEIGPQTVVVNNRAYEVSIYNIDKALLETAEIPVTYMLDENGYMTFYADNIKVRMIDERRTLENSETITDNQDSMRLVGNNCYIFGGYGSDVIIVEGDNNILDGWYGDDSFKVIGNNNEIRGFDGDDSIIIEKGDNNTINGENGNDSLTIIEGTGNTYQNIEKVAKK